MRASQREYSDFWFALAGKPEPPGISSPARDQPALADDPSDRREFVPDHERTYARDERGRCATIGQPQSRPLLRERSTLGRRGQAGDLVGAPSSGHACVSEVRSGGCSPADDGFAALGGIGAVALVAMLCMGCGSRGLAAPSKDFQAVFDASGDPVLLGGPARRGPEGWLICRPGRRCVTAYERDNALQPGFEPAGTVIEASVRSVGRTFTDRAPWLGSVHAITAPRLTGRPRFGTWVKPVAGTWTGGWVGDEDQLAVEACRYRTGNGCVMLSGGAEGCATDDPVGARVGLALTGWYLFTLDSRNALDELCGAPGRATPARRSRRCGVWERPSFDPLRSAR
jgi:hypothetical protein